MGSRARHGRFQEGKLETRAVGVPVDRLNRARVLTDVMGVLYCATGLAGGIQRVMVETEDRPEAEAHKKTSRSKVEGNLKAKS